MLSDGELYPNTVAFVPEWGVREHKLRQDLNENILSFQVVFGFVPWCVAFGAASIALARSAQSEGPIC